PLIDKILKSASSCPNRSLSYTGRVHLIKSVLTAIQVFLELCFYAAQNLSNLPEADQVAAVHFTSCIVGTSRYLYCCITCDTLVVL
ncbi:hypothetical protein Droror1_Dr00024007, partial [Drosera rotundifolia]